MSQLGRFPVLKSIKINFVNRLSHFNSRTDCCTRYLRSTPNSLNNLLIKRSFGTRTQIRDADKLVGKWLLGISGMASVAVILGGVTRLTESGLSMVTWKLLGEKLPKTEKEWEEEFEKYKQFPEYTMKNTEMELKEFKFIFYMEYIHRMWGRTIGAVFILPAVYFWSQGYFCRNTKIRVVALGTLLGAQGLMGWYMVKSGLEDRFKDVNDVPRVSQYRLASHLGLAFIFYAFSLSSAFNKLLPLQKFGKLDSKVYAVRYISHLSKALVFLTAISGAFVAGLDAGLVYNSFPKMADKWIPDDLLSFQPALRNFTENPTTVQFDHRILGITTLSLISGLWLFSRKVSLPKRASWALNSIIVMAWIQVGLGITTLLTYVPTPIAAAHQSGSLVLLSCAMWLTHEMKALKYIPK